MPKKGIYKDLTGQKIGKLTVLGLNRKNEYGHYIWNCRCDCGNLCEVRTGQLNGKHTRSCGCIHRDKLIERNSSHNMAKSPIYNVWSSMKRRCTKEKDPSYKNYGARGITVSEEWLAFENFYNDMGESYRSWLTLDRIDNEKGYCKENCRWVDRIVQASNKRNNVYYTIDGVTDTQSGHCRRYNIKQQNVFKRINNGWSIEDAYKTPLGNRNPNKKK